MTDVRAIVVYLTVVGHASVLLVKSWMDGAEGSIKEVDGSLVKFRDGIGMVVDATAALVPIGMMPVEFADQLAFPVDATGVPVGNTSVRLMFVAGTILEPVPGATGAPVERLFVAFPDRTWSELDAVAERRLEFPGVSDALYFDPDAPVKRGTEVPRPDAVPGNTEKLLNDVGTLTLGAGTPVKKVTPTEAMVSVGAGAVKLFQGNEEAVALVPTTAVELEVSTAIPIDPVSSGLSDSVVEALMPDVGATSVAVLNGRVEFAVTA